MIVAQHIAKSYKKTPCLFDISFCVPEKSILAVAGANGAGKTTLLKIIALLLKPDCGSVEIAGKNALQFPDEVRRMIGYVPQSNALFYELSVEDNIHYWSDSKAGCNLEAVRMLGLEAVSKKRTASLSGGMQRRLNLALAMLHSPKVLIMDEPLSGVDMMTRELLLEWMGALKKQGMSIVYSTHHADEIEHTADRLLILRGGRVSYDAAPDAESRKIRALLLQYS